MLYENLSNITFLTVFSQGKDLVLVFFKENTITFTKFQ